MPSTSYDHWTDQTNSNLSDADGAELFLRQHGVFIDSLAGHNRAVPAEVWLWPVTWSP